LWECFWWFEFSFPEDRASSSPSSFERRLISLMFAGRNRIIMIRRELPLTVIASPVEPVAWAKRGFSFVLALPAASSVFEMDVTVHRFSVLSFFLLREFCLCFGCCQAATCCLEIVSALIPMAQIKPSSSRATAVTIFLCLCRLRPVSYSACATDAAPSTQSPSPLPRCSPVVCGVRTR
jgi:hypothetical protein